MIFYTSPLHSNTYTLIPTTYNPIAMASSRVSADIAAIFKYFASHLLTQNLADTVKILLNNKSEACQVLGLLLERYPNLLEFLRLYLMLLDKATISDEINLAYFMSHPDLGEPEGRNWLAGKEKWRAFFQCIINALNIICEIPGGRILHVLLLDGSPVISIKDGGGGGYNNRGTDKNRDMPPGVLLCASQKGGDIDNLKYPERVYSGGEIKMKVVSNDKEVTIPGGYKCSKEATVQCLQLPESFDKPLYFEQRGLGIELFGHSYQSPLQKLHDERQSVLQKLQDERDAAREQERLKAKAVADDIVKMATMDKALTGGLEGLFG